MTNTPTATGHTPSHAREDTPTWVREAAQLITDFLLHHRIEPREDEEAAEDPPRPHGGVDLMGGGA